MFRKTSRLAFCVAAVVTLALIFGCGENNDPTETSTAGSLAILAAPESMETPWSLSGPAGFTDSGTSTRRVNDLSPGTYTLTWEPVTGWVRPWPTTQTITIESNDDVVVMGEFRTNVPSTVIIDGRPDDSGASWTLRGSEGLIISGTGDQTLTDVDAGHYEVTWETPAGWLNTGPPSVGSEVFGEELTLSTLFAADVETPEGYEYVPASVFTMGSPVGEWGHGLDEIEHEVTLSRDIMMAAYEITVIDFQNQLIWAIDNGYVSIDTTITSTQAGADTSVTITDLLDESGYEVIDFGLINIGFNPSRYNPDDLNENQRSWGFTEPELPNRPITGITWFTAVIYCDWLSLEQGLTRAYNHISWECNGGDPYAAEGYRLPTEAEWEAAARAGSITGFTNGPVLSPVCDDANLNLVGWHCGIATFNVGQKNPNAWGLYDMHGNAWEWCQDWWVAYPDGAVTDPLGEEVNPDQAAQIIANPSPWTPFEDLPLGAGLKADGDPKALRGGSVLSFSAICRSANRSGYDPYWTTSVIGIRPVRTIQ